MKKNETLLEHFVFKKTDTLQIGETDYIFISKFKQRKDIIDNLKKLNVFVGANNSGKSRILRAIFSQDKLINLEVIDELNKFFSEIIDLLNKSRIGRGQLSKTDAFLKEIENSKKDEFYFYEPNFITKINTMIIDFDKVISNPQVFSLNGEPLFTSDLQNIINKYKYFVEKINLKIDRHTLYIPTLRGLRPVNNSDLYYNRTVQDYFYNITLDKKNIFTGFTIYSELQSKLLGTQSDRDFVRDYEKFLSNHFFNDSEITLVPRKEEIKEKENDVVYITFDNNEKKERPIYNLGDGLQTIISITYPLFTWIHENKNKENTYLLACIEEPELYLHPSMQRKLVEVIMDEKFNQIQYFITTHSNHFLDLINDYQYQKKISIYSVLNNEQTKTVRQENDLSNAVYDLLGIKPSSILLANKTIWVEGISDRIYLRKGLELYFKKYSDAKKSSEYVDYAFVEYSGTNLEHYFNDTEETDLKINSLSNLKNVFLLADDDGTYINNSQNAKRERYDKVKEKLNTNFKTTDGWEIENYLTTKILQSIFQDSKLSDIQTSDYFKKKLPEFLNSTYNITKYINKKSKNFSDKTDLAKKAVELQKDWDDLSEEMKKLIVSIIKFIVN